MVFLMHFSRGILTLIYLCEILRAIINFDFMHFIDFYSVLKIKGPSANY